MTAVDSSHDWVEIVDPQTGHPFYANPATGECLWEQKPTAGSIKPANPEGEWCELWNEKYQLPYYYHTHTRTAEWSKPQQENVISLVKIQSSSSAVKDRFKEPSSPPDLDWVEQDSKSMKRNSRSLDFAPFNNNERVGPVPQRSSSADGRKEDDDDTFSMSATSTGNDDTQSMTGSSIFSLSLAKKLTGPARKQHHADAGTQSSRQSHFSMSRASIESAFANFTRSRMPSGDRRKYYSGARSPLDMRHSVAVSAPIAIDEDARAAMNPLNQSTLEPIPLTKYPTTSYSQASTLTSESAISETRKILPTSLQHDINQFAIDGFAQKYFATHKRGLFRRRVPMKEMLEWTKDSLNKPLIMLNKDLNKDAQRCFKMIQMIMGDRSRPRNTNDIEDLQSILSCGIQKGQMRDEIYVQLCKQLNNNPRGESIRKGWEILCAVCITFPPSKNLESYLHNFVQQHHHIKENDVDVMSKHVSAKLKRICVRGAKGKVLTPAEIERAKVAPFKPSVFGEPLEFIMELQRENNKETHDTLQIPRIVPFLAETVHQLNGKMSEGIFRVPGDADAITDLRVRIENGNYDASGITDPNVPASLLKFWIRDLPEPLITAELYDSCIACAEDPDSAIQIINSLPAVNRRIVLYMLSFLQEFIEPEIIKHTLMNVHNLAMVFAPNLLRCPSDRLTTVLENSKYEQAFLRTLLMELSADKTACAYDPAEEVSFGKKKLDS